MANQEVNELARRVARSLKFHIRLSSPLNYSSGNGCTPFFK